MACGTIYFGAVLIAMLDERDYSIRDSRSSVTHVAEQKCYPMKPDCTSRRPNDRPLSRERRIRSSFNLGPPATRRLQRWVRRRLPLDGTHRW